MLFEVHSSKGTWLRRGSLSFGCTSLNLGFYLG